MSWVEGIQAARDVAEIVGFLSVIVGGAYRLGRQDREMRQNTRLTYAIGRRLGILKRTSVPPPPRGPMESIRLEGDEEK